MEKEINIKIGNLLKNIRKETYIKKSDITKILSISSQQLTKYENGINRISACKLILLLKELNIDSNIFFNNNMSKEQTNLLFYFKKIKDYDVRANLLSLIKDVSSRY